MAGYFSLLQSIQMNSGYLPATLQMKVTYKTLNLYPAMRRVL
jgi:hypothetical protein